MLQTSDDDGVEGGAGHEGENEASQGFHLPGAEGGDEEDGDGGGDLGGGFELFGWLVSYSLLYSHREGIWSQFDEVKEGLGRRRRAVGGHTVI